MEMTPVERRIDKLQLFYPLERLAARSIIRKVPNFRINEETDVFSAAELVLKNL